MTHRRTIARWGLGAVCHRGNKWQKMDKKSKFLDVRQNAAKVDID